LETFEFLSDDLRKIVSSLGFEKQTPVQTEAIPAILSGENVLIISPTGSGKTEAALLPVFEKIKVAEGKEGIKAIYVTPLRALNRDMLKRISQWADHLGLSVQIRHGDTPQSERRRQALSPPDILITTPETLQVLLIGKRLRTNMRNLTHVVIDEIHQLASDRRGSQLSMGLERLELLVGRKFQRIGLSATIQNPMAMASFLCGDNRNCKIVDMSKTEKQVEYSLEYPRPTEEDEIQSRELYVSPHSVARLRRIIDLVDGHERTLIFVNGRGVAEELGSRLAALGLKVGVHHGSLPREERERSEQSFKTGELKALVCTATLELGIDIGAVDLVIQYMSPRQVNSLIQRVGRSGHSLSRKSEGIILSVSPEDALESFATSREALSKQLEPTFIHDCPLDVLAHQIAGLLMEYGEVEISDILKIAHDSYSFRSVSKNELLSVARFMETLGYLRIADEKLMRRAKCREYYLQNLSTIRDEKRYNVLDLTSQKKIGILGEEFMILHAEIGLHFIIKGSAWQIESIQAEDVYVTPVQDLGAAVPGWDGELIPIPELVARRTGMERGRLESCIALGERDDQMGLDRVEKSARIAITNEIKNQMHCSRVPTNKRIVVEQFKNYLIVHTSFGDRVNMTLGELFEERLLRLGGLVRNWWSDGYRILIELSTEEFDLDELTKKITYYDATLPSFIEAVLRKHFPFGYEMKFIAERFGALKRGRLLSGEQMKELGVKFRFTPIYEETMREAFATKVDIPRSVEILQALGKGDFEIAAVKTENPSALAIYIMSRYADEEDYSTGSIDSVESMKLNAERELVSLLCFECANLKEFVRVGDLPEEPKCEKCGSRLLSVLFYGARFARSALIKKNSKQPMSDDERTAVAKARRSADIIVSYGKKGAVAQSVYGIGPQMAARVLSKMHDSEDEFYQDLLAAKLKFIETKKYWN
jgi:ATP-dependent Lhr-like helicase